MGYNGLVMKNVNRFLESPWRSDLFEFNMASSGVVDFNKRKAEEERGYPTPNSHWDYPAPGINGHFCLGHHLNIRNTDVQFRAKLHRFPGFSPRTIGRTNAGSR